MKRLIKTGSSFILSVLLTFAMLTGASVGHCAGISVQAAVEHQEVYVGETFLLQIQVQGDDSPPEPDLPAMRGFSVEPRGGQSNSSSSFSIINGKMSRVSKRGYIFNYALTPAQAGTLTIPVIRVEIDGHQYTTRAISMRIRKPEETKDFKLRFGLSKSKCYVGEALTLTATWYIGKDVKEFNFNLPVLSDPRFVVADAPGGPSAQSRADNLLRIPLGRDEVIAEKGNGVLDGKQYLTVKFSKLLIPIEAGRMKLPQATVVCKALSGYQHRRNNDPFDDFFGRSILGQSREVYRTIVVPSNEPMLEVLPLPKKDRPGGFSGLVGHYSLAVSAAPTEVKVGDPITLTVQVAGPYVDGVDDSFIKGQLAAGQFKVPEDMAPGEANGELKTFTQTIRARNSSVTEIPALMLSYFDPTEGRYRSASSDPVPIKVSGTRVVTALDAEGTSPSGPVKREIRAAEDGINFNYKGRDLLVSQETSEGRSLQEPLWYILLGIPPVLYLLVLIGVVVRRHRQLNPKQQDARKAKSRFEAALKGVSGSGGGGSGRRCEVVGEALREYLGARLGLNSAALVYADVEPRLLTMGVSVEIMEKLKDILDHCEAYHYAGGVVGSDFDLLGTADKIVDDIESSDWKQQN